VSDIRSGCLANYIVFLIDVSKVRRAAFKGAHLRVMQMSAIAVAHVRAQHGAPYNVTHARNHD
jgi:hypothetical protein